MLGFCLTSTWPDHMLHLPAGHVHSYERSNPVRRLPQPWVLPVSVGRCEWQLSAAVCLAAAWSTLT